MDIMSIPGAPSHRQDSAFPDLKIQGVRFMTFRWIVVTAFLLGIVPAINAQPFAQCPHTPKSDFDVYTFTGCISLIIANADGTFTVKEDMSQPSNDVGHGEHDDALVGFQNNSGAPVSAIRIAGCESSVDFTACFAFDGSGLVQNNHITFCPVAS